MEYGRDVGWVGQSVLRVLHLDGLDERRIQARMKRQKQMSSLYPCTISRPSENRSTTIMKEQNPNDPRDQYCRVNVRLHHRNSSSGLLREDATEEENRGSPALAKVPLEEVLDAAVERSFVETRRGGWCLKRPCLVPVTGWTGCMLTLVQNDECRYVRERDLIGFRYLLANTGVDVGYLACASRLCGEIPRNGI